MIPFFKPNTKLVPVQVPDMYGEPPPLEDLKAALADQAGHEIVRGVIHLIMMRRTQVSMSARGMAKRGQDAAFDLGGQDALDELFSDLHGLITNAEPGDLVKEWFRKPD